METRNKPRPTDTPTYFTKPPTSLNGHGGQILKPVDCRYLNYEGEYAVVIGRTCRNVLPDEAWDYIEAFRPALGVDERVPERFKENYRLAAHRQE